MLGSTFKDFTIYTTTKETTKTLGNVLTTYLKKSAVQCDIQPIEENTKTKTWGNDIESTWQVFCDEDMNVGDIIIYNNKSYSIEKKIDWISYKIYAIKEVDIKVNG